MAAAVSPRGVRGDLPKRPLPLRPYLVVDRNLYTGHNPASSAMLAHKLVADHGSPALHSRSAGSSLLIPYGL